MAIIWVIVIGFVVGLVARAVLPGKDPGGLIVTTLLGIAGAVVAHFLGRTFGLYAPEEPVGFIASVLGAIVLLLVYRVARRPAV